MTQMPPPRRIELPALEVTPGQLEEPMNLSVHTAGEGPAVVLCHGFPEFIYNRNSAVGRSQTASARLPALSALSAVL